MDEPREFGALAIDNLNNLFKELHLLKQIPNELTDLIVKQYVLLIRQYVLEKPESIQSMDKEKTEFVNQLFAQDFKALDSDYHKIIQQADKKDDDKFMALMELVVQKKEFIPLLWNNNQVAEQLKKDLLVVIKRALALSYKEPFKTLIKEIKGHFQGIDLSNLTFADLQLVGSNLMGSKLDGTDLYGSNLSGSNLSNTSFIGSDVRHVNFEGANLSNSNFTGANLGSANCIEAILKDVNFAEAQTDYFTKINVNQLESTQSIIGAKILATTESANEIKLVVDDYHDEKHESLYMRIWEHDIEPLKKIVINQIKEQSTQCTDIPSLIDLFNHAQSDETLRINRSPNNQDILIVMEGGQTTSCKEAMHTVVQQLVKTIQNMKTPLDDETVKKLIVIHAQMNIGHPTGFFDKPTDLLAVIKQNQALPPLKNLTQTEPNEEQKQDTLTKRM